MKKYDAEHLRNVGIIGHGSVGKTSLTEALLFNAKVIDRLGKVDDGTTTTDYDDDEKKRKITINTAVAYYEWNKQKINLIDTPGFADFIADTKIALSVAEFIFTRLLLTDCYIISPPSNEETGLLSGLIIYQAIFRKIYVP